MWGSRPDAPVAPLAIAYSSSGTEHESFQMSVSVVRTVSASGVSVVTALIEICILRDCALTPDGPMLRCGGSVT